MKRVTAFIAAGALLCGTLGAAAPQPPNPQDYPLTVHVVASRLKAYEQELEADVEGRRVELEGGGSTKPPAGLLVPGDYKARRVADVPGAPKKRNGFDLYLLYEFLMPDGKTRWYQVVGICTAEAKTCARP